MYFCVLYVRIKLMFYVKLWTYWHICYALDTFMEIRRAVTWLAPSLAELEVNIPPIVVVSCGVEVCMIREFRWVPWESHGNGRHRVNSWEWEREWEWWTGNGSKMGIVVWRKFTLVALIIFWHYIFQRATLLHSNLGVIWLFCGSLENLRVCTL